MTSVPSYPSSIVWGSTHLLCSRGGVSELWVSLQRSGRLSGTCCPLLCFLLNVTLLHHFDRSDKENCCLLLGPPGRDLHRHQRHKNHSEGVKSQCKPEGTRYFSEKWRALLVSKHLYVFCKQFAALEIKCIKLLLRLLPENQSYYTQSGLVSVKNSYHLAWIQKDSSTEVTKIQELSVKDFKPAIMATSLSMCSTLDMIGKNRVVPQIIY